MFWDGRGEGKIGVARGFVCSTRLDTLLCSLFKQLGQIEFPAPIFLSNTNLSNYAVNKFSGRDVESRIPHVDSLGSDGDGFDEMSVQNQAVVFGTFDESHFLSWALFDDDGGAVWGFEVDGCTWGCDEEFDVVVFCCYCL